MKEQADEKVINHPFWHRNKRLVIIISTLVVVLSAAAVVILTTGSKPVDSPKKESENNSSITALESQTPSNPVAEESPAVKSADDYYADGQASMSSQNWEQAVIAFDQALALDTKNPNFYNRKSQAQYNLNQKDQAISTLQEGLSNNPNNDLLESRLDVLQKDYVGSQPQ